MLVPFKFCSAVVLLSGAALWPAVLPASAQASGQPTPLTVYQDEYGRPTSGPQGHRYCLITRQEQDTALYQVETFSLKRVRIGAATYRAVRHPVGWADFGGESFGDAVQEGLSTEYHANGKTKFEGRFRDGKGEGTHRRYYASGKLLSETTLSDGITVGTVRAYNENGRLQTEFQTKGGHAHGAWTEYTATGKVSIKATYADGRPVQAVYYDQEGRQIAPSPAIETPAAPPPATGN